MFSVLGLGLDHSCTWPREGLSSKSRSSALASDFFESLALASKVVSSAPPLLTSPLIFLNVSGTANPLMKMLASLICGMAD